LRSAKRKLAALIIAVAMTAGCFETQPVREQIDVFFHEDGAAEVAITTEITLGAYDDDNPRLRDRVSRLGEDLIGGANAWSRGISAVGPERERRTYEFDKGHLTQTTLESLLLDPEKLPVLFEEFPVGAFVSREGAVVTLEFVPARLSRASERQERRVSEAAGAFAGTLESYLRSLSDLYDYLERNPSRARACFAKLLGITGDAAGEGAELSPKEAELADAADKAQNALLDILTVSKGEAFTVDELSQLVFDPFPGPVTVEVTGRVIDQEGFEFDEDGRYLVPEIGLWSALEALEDRWVSPLPVVEMVAAYREEQESGEEADEAAILDSLTSYPREVRSLARKEEILSAIEDELRPAEVYRLRWRLPIQEEGAISAR